MMISAEEPRSPLGWKALFFPAFFAFIGHALTVPQIPIHDYFIKYNLAAKSQHKAALDAPCTAISIPLWAISTVSRIPSVKSKPCEP